MTTEAGSGPAVCSLAPASERMDVFADQNFAVWWRVFDGQNWLPWESLGGELTSDPAVMVLGGAAFVFARGRDGAIDWQWIRSGTDRSGWQRLEGILANSGPAVCSLAPASDRMDVFVRGQDFALWWRVFDGQNWLPWESLGGELTSDPAVMVPGGAAFVFARGRDGAIDWQWIRSGTDRSGWQRLEGMLANSGPAVCSLAPASARMDVFVRGQDFALWWRVFDGQNWLPWESLGGELTSDPAVMVPGGAAFVFARGTDGAIDWQWIRSGTDRSGWQRLYLPRR